MGKYYRVENLVTEGYLSEGILVVVKGGEESIELWNKLVAVLAVAFN